MAASRDLRSHVTDVVTCPICLELFNSPKSLPCLHTFCLKCIEGHCRDNEPGDEVACPVCRQKFNIPQSGVKGLISNFFIAGLVEARKTASDVKLQAPCEVCSQECDNFSSNVVASRVYCVDCKQKLCERCSTPHRRMKGGPHKLVPIGGEVETELIQTHGGKCDKHNGDDVRLYCFDCQMNICVICFAEEHKQHDCRNVNTVADQYIKQIDADLEKIRQMTHGARDEMNRLDVKRQEFLSDVDGVRDSISRKGDEMKQLIDARVNELMLEVQSLKTKSCKEIENLKDSVEMKLLAFETFSAYCSELKLKGKPCDVTRAANDLHIRATELLQNDVTVEDYRAPTVTFTPMNIKELTDAGENFLGRVLLNNITPLSPSKRGMKVVDQQLAQSTDTERSIRQQIEECHQQMAEKDEMWTQKVNELQAQIRLLNEREIEAKCVKTESNKATDELTAQCEQLRNSERDLNVKLEKSEKTVKTLQDQIQQLTKSENDLKVRLVSCEKSVNDYERKHQEFGRSESESKSNFGNSDKSLNVPEREYEIVKEVSTQVEARGKEMQLSERGATWRQKRLSAGNEPLGKTESSWNKEWKSVQLVEPLLKEYQLIVPRVVHTLPETELVRGVTSVGDELYLLRVKDGEQVEVYYRVQSSNKDVAQFTTSTVAVWSKIQPMVLV